MRITMRVTGMPRAMKMVQRVKDIAADTTPLAFAGLRATGEMFEDNFMSEGGSVGGWASLAERTVQERISKGFGGDHPILVRYGDLREVTATSLRALEHSQTVTMTDSDGKSIGVQVAGRKGVVNVTAFGDKAVNQEPGGSRPARPYWWVDGRVEQAARKGVVEHLGKELRKL